MKTCGGRLQPHGLQGRTKDALILLQNLTKKTGYFFYGGTKSVADVKANLVKFLAERRICTERWAREIIKFLAEKRWLEVEKPDRTPVIFKGFAAILVRQHRQWAAETKDPTCSLKPAGIPNCERKPTSAQTEGSSVQTEVPSAKQSLSPMPETVRVLSSLSEGYEGGKGNVPSPQNNPQTNLSTKELLGKLGALRFKKIGHYLRLTDKQLPELHQLVADYGALQVYFTYSTFLCDDRDHYSRCKWPWLAFVEDFAQHMFPADELEYLEIPPDGCEGKILYEGEWRSTEEVEHLQDEKARRSWMSHQLPCGGPAGEHEDGKCICFKKYSYVFNGCAVAVGYGYGLDYRGSDEASFRMAAFRENPDGIGI